MSAWKQFCLLLKVQMRPVLLGKKQVEESGKKKKSQVGYVILITFSLAIILATVTVAFIGMAEVLSPLGMLSVIPTIGVAGGCLFCLFTTIYKTNGLLFGFQDYDLVMSLPFRSGVVVAARLMILYVYNLSFMLAVMVPAGVVYGIYAHASAAFYVAFAIETLLTPLIPDLVATFIGTLISLVASRFQRRGVMGIVFTLVFMVAWMLFIYNADFLVEQAGVFGPQLAQGIAAVYPPAAWFTEGCCDLNMGAFALYAGVSIGLYLVFCWIVGKYFRAINSLLTSYAPSAHFRMKTLKADSAFRALLRKEWKRLIGSSNYFMNAAIGPIMAVVLSALLCFGLSGTLSDFGEVWTEIGPDTGMMYAAVALFISFFVSMTMTSCVSISLEGPQLWIVKSAPVSTQDVLRSKLTLNLLIASAGAVGAGLFLIFSFPPDALYSPFLILSPLIFGLWSTVWGQQLNLRYAQFDWLDEMKVVKRSKPVTYLMLVEMALVFGSITLCALTGPWLMFAVDGALLAWAWLTYRWLMTKGVQVFDAFSA